MSNPRTNSIRAGMKIPLFQRRGKPSPVSVSDMNVLVRVLNALLNARVVVTAGQETRIDISDLNWLLTLGPDLFSSVTGGVTYDPNPYDPTKGYNAFTIVRSTGAGSSTPGVWIAVVNVPANGDKPLWTESTKTEANNSWQRLSFGPTKLHYQDPNNACAKMRLTADATAPINDV